MPPAEWRIYRNNILLVGECPPRFLPYLCSFAATWSVTLNFICSVLPVILVSVSWRLHNVLENYACRNTGRDKNFHVDFNVVPVTKINQINTLILMGKGHYQLPRERTNKCLCTAHSLELVRTSMQYGGQTFHPLFRLRISARRSRLNVSLVNIMRFDSFLFMNDLWISVLARQIVIRSI